MSIVVLVLATALSALAADAHRPPITREGFFRAVEIGGLEPDEFASVVRARRVGFRLTPEERGRLRSTGLDPRVIEAVDASFQETETVVPSQKPATQPQPVAPAVNESGILEVPKQVQALRLLTKPLIHYPFAARQARVSGVVRFDAVVGEDGRVEKLRVASGHPLLVAGADREVSKFRYEPAAIDGKPVRVKTEIELTFRLPD